MRQPFYLHWVQLRVAYSVSYLDALWVERALLCTLAFFPKTKPARERAFHHFPHANFNDTHLH